MTLFLTLFLVPSGIHQVTVGDFHIEFLVLFRIHLFDELGRHSTPDFSGTDLRTFQHQGTGCHDGTFTYHDTIKQGAAHTDERVIVNVGAVNRNIVAYRHIIADGNG